MKQEDHINYQRIAEAIQYIQANFKDQPNLDEVAEKVHLSPFHFQRLFSEWAGTSPKKFLQYTSIQYAKSLLKQNQSTVSDAAYETGLSGTSRLHDLFINIEGMTPAEYKNGGRELTINYSFGDIPFGRILIATTTKGVCHIAFVDDDVAAFNVLQGYFLNAHFVQQSNAIQQQALQIFKGDWKELSRVKLHLKGTDFQLKVWEALLKIPMGHLSTYGSIAAGIQHPKAARAVGTAIGDNPVAFLIPCHRVIQASGSLGGYMWGTTRKTAMIGWEAARMNERSL